MSSILQKEVVIGSNSVKLVESSIKDGVTTPLIVKKSTNTPTFISNMTKKMSHGVGQILPKNCRFSRPLDSNTSILILEDQPKPRFVKFKYDFLRERELVKITGQQGLNAERFITGNKEIYTLKLAFPYIVYIMLICEFHDKFEVPMFNVFFRSHPISRFNDYLNIANILNLSESNTLCFGRSATYYKNDTPTISDLGNFLTSDFWNKPFTDEYQSRHYMYQNHDRLHSFIVWAHYSEKDPMFVYSTNWIKHVNNLSQEINYVSRVYSSQSSESKFQNIFVESIDPEIEQENNEIELFPYDNMQLGEQVISLGDQIKYNDTDMYISALIGNRDDVNSFILIDDEGNQTERIELTDELKRDWEEQISQQLNNYVDEVTFGEKIAKVNGLIKIIPTNNYEVIQKIRITRDKEYEFVLGNRFYMAREDVFEVIDLLKINNVEVNIGESYIICNNQHQVAFTGKLTRIQNNNYGVLYFFFRDLNTDEERGISVDSFENGDSTISTIDNSLVEAPPIFRYLDRLIVNSNNHYFIVNGKKIYSTYSAITDANRFPIEYDQHNTDDIIDNILTEDKQKLSIPGTDIDINFQVGDEVIVSDWKNPHEYMFKIRKISGFKVEGGRLFFQLIDSENNEKSIEYIDLYNGIIKIGYIRKVKSERDGIYVGTRAIVEAAGCFGFQKGTKHEIAAFIIDSEKPMILFKNGVTIWYEDLNKYFTLIRPDSEEYRTIKTVRKFKPRSIKWQAGDLCTKDDKIYVINNGNSFVGVIYMSIDPDYIRTGSLRTRAVISEEINENFVRYGIIDPRYRKKDVKIIHRTVPTFHNSCREVSYDGYYPYTILKNQEVK